MPEIDTYAASCNPSRRAKRPRADLASPIEAQLDIPAMAEALQSRPTVPILPKRPNKLAGTSPGADHPDEHSAPSPPAPGPAKRGRKPGPLSRSAREAQRKLNHSIIEKARRTKINDALATLRQLVPVDYGDKGTQQEDIDDPDADYEDAQKKGNVKGKTMGKREEKEKEFKLEILIRTVSFMQDLLERVAALEKGSSGCASCARKRTLKRKRTPSIEEEGTLYVREDGTKALSVERGDSNTPKARPTYYPAPEMLSGGPNPSESRLPSISSWLPNSQIDPSLLSPVSPPPQSTHAIPAPIPYSNVAQLPSPPSSTRFDPVRSSQVPPALSLGPVATSAMFSPTRTAEDESAASLLLQISHSSSLSLPLSSSSSSSCAPFELPKPWTAGPREGNPKPSRFTHAQTPSSLLGLGHGKS